MTVKQLKAFIELVPDDTPIEIEIGTGFGAAIGAVDDIEFSASGWKNKALTLTIQAKTDFNIPL